MRHQLKKHLRAFVCRIAAASLILGMAAPGIYPAEETADKGTRLRAGATPETETKSEIKPAAEIKAKADTMNREHRKERITISGVEDLAELAGRCVLDTNSRDFEVVLTKDITLTGISFTPIPYFSGIFDGQGHDQGDRDSLRRFQPGLYAFCRRRSRDPESECGGQDRT